MYKGRTNYETWAIETYLQSTEYGYNCVYLEYVTCKEHADGNEELATEATRP